MTRTFRLMIVSLLLAISWQVSAEEKCQSQPLPSPHNFFIDLYQQSANLGKAICESYGEEISPELHQQYLNFANQVVLEVKRTFKPLDHTTLPAFFDNVEQLPALASHGLDKGQLPQFVYVQGFSEFADAGFTLVTEAMPTINIEADVCQLTEEKTCDQLLSDLDKAIKPLSDMFTRKLGFERAREYARINSEWERFLTEGRAQFLLDRLATTAIYGKSIRDGHLKGPLDFQFFALHPSLVYESIGALPSGQKESVALAIEWFGWNWWKGVDVFGQTIPLGFSIASVYRDEPGVDNLGTGIMVHIDNDFSLGYAHHGDEGGVYFSIDLAKAISNKQSEWKAWREEIDSLY